MMHEKTLDILLKHILQSKVQLIWGWHYLKSKLIKYNN